VFLRTWLIIKEKSDFVKYQFELFLSRPYGRLIG